MQYDSELFPYQRVRKFNKGKEEKKLIHIKIVLKLIFYFTGALLVSRVMLVNSTAPFGIALLITVIIHMEDRIPLVVGCGSLLGYLSLYNNIKNMGMYFVMIGTIVILGYILASVDITKRLIFLFISIFIETWLYLIVINKQTIGITFIDSFFQTACIFPIYFILNHSIKCFKEVKSKHLFSSEEIISMAVTTALVVAGTWGLAIYKVSITNILALILILIISYVKGAPVGAASGVAVGVIVGMTSGNMLAYISVYSFCGLIHGIFKESGKWFSIIAFIIAFSIIKVYSSSDFDIKLIEVLISVAVFLSFSKNNYSSLALELDWEKKIEGINKDYGNKIKHILIDRLNGFSEVLFGMSDILKGFVDNEKLRMKNKSSALIENLADRVCANCEMNSMCWKREMYYTYNAFAELIQGYQERRNIIPGFIEKKCVKKNLLLKNAEYVIDSFMMNEMWRSRINEGREIISSEIRNIAGSVEDIVDEVNKDIKFNNKEEKDIMRILDRAHIKYNDVFCYSSKDNRLIVRLTMNACGGRQFCIKEILPLINEVSGKCMCVSGEGCDIDVKDQSCTIVFEETPKYHIASYAARQCKNGEDYNGDSYSFGRLKDGTYMTIISDGMGSGPEAGQESQSVIDLVETLTSAGFSTVAAINTLNSIMTLKFSVDEKFSTVDLSTINLYTGEIEFMKVGAVSSFIKSIEDVKAVKSRTLPIGVLDKADIEISKSKVKNGDMIVMLSDGILDYNSDNTGSESWVIDYLENNNTNDPRELAVGLLAKAKELSGEKIRDDMTVVVSRVYSLY